MSKFNADFLQKVTLLLRTIRGCVPCETKKLSTRQPWMLTIKFVRGRRVPKPSVEDPTHQLGLYILIDRPGSRHRHLAIRTLYYTS